MEIGYDAEGDIQGLGTVADGRIGRQPATGAEYAMRHSPSFEIRRNVIDPSEGANYSGGSDYAPGIPLGPSTWGLAAPTLEDAMGSFEYGLGGFDVLLEGCGDLALLPSEPEPVERDHSDLFASTVASGSHNAFDGLHAVDPAAGMSNSDRSMRTVLKAALLPGSSQAGEVTTALASKGVVLAKIAHDRAQAAFKARREIHKLVSKVDKMEGAVKAAAAKIMVGSNQGTLLNPNAEPADIRKFETLRKQQIMAAKRAVRMQKVNVLATAMAQNAAAQATLTHQIAGTVLTGQPDAAAALSVAYNKIGGKTEQMRAIRKKQISNSVMQNKKDTLAALLTRKAGLLRRNARAQIILSRCTVADRPKVIAELRKFQAEVDAVDRQLRALCGTNQSLGVSGLDGLEADLDGMLAELEWFGSKIWKKAKKAVKKTYKAAKKTYKTAYKIAVPFKSVRKALNKSLRYTAKVAGKAFVGWPCKFMTSSVGRVATKIGGTAVGTVYGGPVGGGVGAAAADRANDLNKNICGGLKRLGLTEGKFRASRLGSVIKKSASTFAKNAVSPKKFMRSAMTIGTAYVGGGMGSSAATGMLAKFGGNQIARLGLQQAQNYGQKRLTSYAAKTGGRYLGKAIGGRTGQIVGSLAAQGAQMAAQGRLDADAFSRYAKQQLSGRNLQKLAMSQGQRLALQQVRRNVPASRMFLGKQGQIGYPSAARTQRYLQARAARVMTPQRYAALARAKAVAAARQRYALVQRRGVAALRRA